MRTAGEVIVEELVEGVKVVRVDGEVVVDPVEAVDVGGLSVDEADLEPAEDEVEDELQVV